MSNTTGWTGAIAEVCWNHHRWLGGIIIGNLVATPATYTLLARGDYGYAALYSAVGTITGIAASPISKRFERFLYSSSPSP